VSREETLLALLETHGDALRRIARFHAGSGGEEDDLHQEILLQVWRSLPSFRGESAPGTWLYRVALNTALTWRRRTRRGDAKAALLDPARDDRASAAADYHRADADILADFLGSLRGPDRSVLLLYMEGLSHREIADVTGLGESAVGVRIHRMKRAFTERYVEDQES